MSTVHVIMQCICGNILVSSFGQHSLRIGCSMLRLHKAHIGQSKLFGLAELNDAKVGEV